MKPPRHGSDLDLETWGLLGLVGTVGAISGYTTLSLDLAQEIGGPTQEVPWHPVKLLCGLLTDELVWSTEATIVALGMPITGCAVCAAGIYAGRRWWRTRPKRRDRKAIDAQAQFMGRGKEIDGLKEAAVAERAASLQVRLPQGSVPGVFIGNTIRQSVFDRSQRLYGSYEDLHVDIWGPRQGKTTSRVIPAIMQAPGPVVATSNKRDVVDGTRLHRESVGDVYIFDPQGVADAEPTFYWDPIAWVASGKTLALMEQRAAVLTGHFAASVGEDRSVDAFFEPSARKLIRALIIAAVVAKAPITKIAEWIEAEHDDSPRLLLHKAGFRTYAGVLAQQYGAPSKQKGGVFATAGVMTECLNTAAIVPWVTPSQDGEQPRSAFDVRAFAKSRDTLYALSLEGEGNAGALVTALTDAVTDAAMDLGSRSPRGRLSVPMLAVLDEAANIVRWPALPKLYSHFGSRGIVVMTILQSWAQGERCWGRAGMDTLWSAATLRVLGSGVDDPGFLSGRSETIGDHYESSVSVSKSHGGSQSTTTSRIEARTLKASDLAKMPRGRAVLFSAANPAVLFETVPWFEHDFADKVRASLERYEPKFEDEATVAPLHIVHADLDTTEGISA
ncbi:type IV secretory system conjugative DNA transfer family protein [Nocardia sp. NPDC060249]|uniref:type IV secretory system conjugative DNA transfer family protein n=1 Tax=Nocardia sp. NPDC060249 TaxID=3347082 RepID=UPI00365D15E0